LIETQGDLLYGIHPVYMALAAKRRTVHRIYFNKGSEKASKIAHYAGTLGIPCQRLSRPNLDDLTRQSFKYKDHHVHQGIVADVSRLHHIPLDYKMPQVDGDSFDYEQHLSSERFVLLLYGVRDPMNMGALLRSAYFFGIKTVLVAGDRTDLSAIVSKTSSGAMEVINILALRNPTPFLADLSEQGWNIIALSLPSPCLATCTSLSQATIGQRNNLIIIGSEGEGIPDDLLEELLLRPQPEELL